MTTYHLGRRKRPDGGLYRPRQLLLIVALVAVLVFGGAFLNQRLGGGALALSRPFWSARDLSASAWLGFTSLFANKNKLTLENQALRSELELARAQLQERDLLIQDNTWLRGVLGRTKVSSTRQIARVLVGWQSNPSDIINLDLGRDNAAPVPQIGENVLTGGNIWLGQVAEVYSKTSKVRLLSLGGQITPAVLGQDRVPVRLTGRGGGNFVAMLPRGVSVVVGDLALVSGVDRDWIVAVVGSVQFDNTGTEQKIFLRQPVRATSLKYVELANN